MRKRALRQSEGNRLSSAAHLSSWAKSWQAKSGGPVGASCTCNRILGGRLAALHLRQVRPLSLCCLRRYGITGVGCRVACPEAGCQGADHGCGAGHILTLDVRCQQCPCHTATPASNGRDNYAWCPRTPMILASLAVVRAKRTVCTHIETRRISRFRRVLETTDRWVIDGTG